MPQADATEPARIDGAGLPHTVILGVVSAPGTSNEIAEQLRPELAERIGARLPAVGWVVRFESDRLVNGPADLTQIIAAARRRLIDKQWHLAVCITDLPLQTTRRPVVAHASMTHGVAVLSLPALGAVGVARRASDAIVRLVTALVGDADPQAGTMMDAGGLASTESRRRGGALTRRLHQLGDRVEADSHGVGLVAGVITGNLRLLLGMLRANRPWRLAIRLSRALVAAVAAAVFALVTSDIWRLADRFGPARLALLMLCSVAAVVFAIILGADLWERNAPTSSARKQIIMFNVVTLATVVIGVLALYIALLALNVLAAFLLLPREAVADVLGHDASTAGVAALAWLATSVATVGGALGAGLETDEAVREAAYGYHADEELGRR